MSYKSLWIIGPLYKGSATFGSDLHSGFFVIAEKKKSEKNEMERGLRDLRDNIEKEFQGKE